MARTNVDVDEQACAEVMRRYRLETKDEAVNLALRMAAGEPDEGVRDGDVEVEPLTVEELRALEGIGWEGDLDEMRVEEVIR